MNAPVGTAGTRKPDWIGSDRAQCALQLILNRAAAGLSLPTQKAAAVVFDS